MLQYSAVYPSTLAVLKKLMLHVSLSDFYLVGGTALALQIGHRISVDIDLFSEKEFSAEDLFRELKTMDAVEVIGMDKHTLNLTIEDCKTDIIRFNYPLLEKILNEDGIRMLHKKDIAAMKLSAIANRGSKKDFFDLFFLLKEYPLNEILGFYTHKFGNRDKFHIYKSLTFFNDAEMDPDPIMLIKTTWLEVKSNIQNEVKKLLL